MTPSTVHSLTTPAVIPLQHPAPNAAAAVNTAIFVHLAGNATIRGVLGQAFDPQYVTATYSICNFKGETFIVNTNE